MIRMFTEQEIQDLIADLKKIQANRKPGTITDGSDLPHMEKGTAATVHAVMIPKSKKSTSKKE